MRFMAFCHGVMQKGVSWIRQKHHHHWQRDSWCALKCFTSYQDGRLCLHAEPDFGTEQPAGPWQGGLPSGLAGTPHRAGSVVQLLHSRAAGSGCGDGVAAAAHATAKLVPVRPCEACMPFEQTPHNLDTGGICPNTCGGQSSVARCCTCFPVEDGNDKNSTPLRDTSFSHGDTVPLRNLRLQYASLHHSSAVVPCWYETLLLILLTGGPLMSCRRATCDSEFDAASLAVLYAVKTLTLLDLEQRYGWMEEGKLRQPPEKLVAAVADLQQHNPTLKVCMRIIRHFATLPSVEARLRQTLAWLARQRGLRKVVWSAQLTEGAQHATWATLHGTTLGAGC